MILESILITGCLYGTQTSCQKTGEAYYKYSGYERMISDYSQKINDKAPSSVKFLAGAGYMVYTKTYRLDLFNKDFWKLYYENKNQNNAIVIRKEF